VAVVCDFDGTAILDDIADALSIEFGGRENWEDANRRFHAGELSFEALLRRIFEPIAATPEQVNAFALERARFRPGFEELLAYCRARGVRFVLASGGLDLYIHPALTKLPPALVHGLELRANGARHVPGGLALSYPWAGAPGACGKCGSCKGAIVKELQAAGHVVVAVGDGNADRCMAGVAEHLFARGRLLDWCRREGVACEPFETFAPVLARVRRLAGDREEAA
jgi:2-hydroxy-3-keto-5-methylthiopentenyl-1-phosphate phosphatase